MFSVSVDISSSGGMLISCSSSLVSSGLNIVLVMLFSVISENVLCVCVLEKMLVMKFQNSDIMNRLNMLI